jgi:hypothetical protein
MNQHSVVTAAGLPVPTAHRADAGRVRLSGRDVGGLLLCGDMYGAPYGLLAAALEVRADRLRGIVARWRRAGYCATGRLGPGLVLADPIRTGGDRAGHAPAAHGRTRR